MGKKVQPYTSQKKYAVGENEPLNGRKRLMRDNTVVLPVSLAQQLSLDDEDDAHATKEKAERHRNLTHPRFHHTDPSTGQIKFQEVPLCGFPMERFLSYGVGNFLYFRSLFCFGILFFVCFCLICPTMVITTQAARSAGVETDFGLAISVGALYEAPSNYTASMFGKTFSQSDLQLWVSIADCLYAVLIYLSIYVIKHKLHKVAHKYEHEASTLNLYTIMVTNLPEEATRKDYQLFFTESFGEVADVALAHNDHDLLQLCVERTHIHRQQVTYGLAGNQGKVEESKIKYAQKLDAIKAMKQELDRFPVVAFVTFEHRESVEAALETYPDRWVFRCCFPKKRRFLGKKIKVHQAPEASNLIYANLKYSKSEKRNRRIWTGLFSVLIIFFNIGLMWCARAVQNSLNLNTKQLDCKQPILASEVLAGTETAACYCPQLKFREAALDALCKSWLLDYAEVQAMYVGMALLVVVVNSLLRKAIKKIGRWELHGTLTEEQLSVTLQLFLAVFTNTAVIITVVNASFDAYLGAGNGDALDWLFTGEYTDMTSKWYTVVGLSIAITCAVHVVNPHVLYLLSACLHKCKRWRKVGHITQTQLNKRFEGPVFGLAERYAELMNVIFVCLVYSAGIPMLMLFLFATMPCMFWFDKIAFFRLYSTPPRYDKQLSEYALSLVPYAVLLHLAFAFWALTAEGSSSYVVFPHLTEAISDYVNKGISLAGGEGVVEVPSDIFTRLSMWNGFIPFVAFWSILLLELLKRLVYLLLARFCEEKMVHVETFKTLNESLSEMPPSSYHTNQQKDYADAYAAIDTVTVMNIEEPMVRIPDSPDFCPKYFVRGHYWKVRQNNPSATPFISTDSVTSYGAGHEEKLAVQQHFQHDGGWSQVHENMPQHGRHVPMSCPYCFNTFQIVDIGQLGQYTCPFCHQQMLM